MLRNKNRADMRESSADDMQLKMLMEFTFERPEPRASAVTGEGKRRLDAEFDEHFFGENDITSGGAIEEDDEFILTDLSKVTGTADEELHASLNTATAAKRPRLSLQGTVQVVLPPELQMIEMPAYLKNRPPPQACPLTPHPAPEVAVPHTARPNAGTAAGACEPAQQHATQGFATSALRSAQLHTAKFNVGEGTSAHSFNMTVNAGATFCVRVEAGGQTLQVNSKLSFSATGPGANYAGSMAISHGHSKFLSNMDATWSTPTKQKKRDGLVLERPSPCRGRCCRRQKQQQPQGDVFWWLERGGEKRSQFVHIQGDHTQAPCV